MARRINLAGLLLILWLMIALLLTTYVGDIEARKTSSSRRSGSSGSSWSWGSNSKSKSTPKSNQQHQQHGQSGSNPGSIGWNVPSNQKPASGSTMPKASAPSNEHMSKSSATNVQSHYPSGNPPPYNPSGGYHGGNPPSYSAGNYHGGNPPPYSAGNYHGNSAPHGSMGSHYGNPPPYSGHGSSPYGGYPGYGAAGGHGSFSSSPGQGYNPSYGHSSFGASQPQTVVLQSQRPGIGQLAKEAFVFAGVSAGVNAAVNRILPGGIYGHSHSSSGAVPPPVSHTQITYNNYYNNGTAAEGQPSMAAPQAPAAGAAAGAAAAAAGPAAAAAAADATSEAAQPAQSAAPQQNASQPQVPQFAISDDELAKISEELFEKDENNAFKYINVNLQGRKTDDSKTDDAQDNLLEVKPEAYEIPTVKAVVALLDNYELDVNTKEVVSSEERKEEEELLNAFMATDVMKTTMKRLAAKGLLPDDEYEFKDTLKRMWFSQFKRIDGEPSSSGFETVFLAEKFDNEIIGLHDWIYFAKQEEEKKINYLGYIKRLDLGSKGAIIKGRSSLNDTVQPITTIFVGTSPELEMALYTLCFYARPNMVCPVSLGGDKFIIVVNAVNYFGKDIIVSAFPDF